MRFIKKFLLLVVLVVIGLVGIAYLLPREVAVARTVQINAPAAEVFPHVNSLKAAAEWSPWLDRDPNVALTYTGPDEGVGAKLAWASDHPEVGNGTQEIIATEPGKSVTTALDFGPMGVATATYDLTESAGTTTVTWGFESDMGMNPMGRWMGLMMDRWVGADFETGLANLKGLVEG